MVNKDRLYYNARLNRWRKEHPENVKRYKQNYYLANREKELEKDKQWRIDNPKKWRICHRASTRAYKIRKKNASGSLKKHDWAILLEIYNWTCPMCWKKEPEIHLSVDHKIPLSKGGTNYLDNIQPLCLNCNAKKGSKIWFASCPLIGKIRTF